MPVCIIQPAGVTQHGGRGRLGRHCDRWRRSCRRAHRRKTPRKRLPGTIDVVGAEQELPYERPPLSKNVLTAPRLPDNAYILPNARWTELGVRFHLGTNVSLIDRRRRRILLAEGTELGYRHLVLATGLRRAACRPGSGRSAGSYLRSFADASVLRPLIGPGTRSSRRGRPHRTRGRGKRSSARS